MVAERNQVEIKLDRARNMLDAYGRNSGNLHIYNIFSLDVDVFEAFSYTTAAAVAAVSVVGIGDAGWR